MDKKHLSFIIMPHDGRKQTVASFSKKRFRILTGIVGLLLVCFLVVLIDYFFMSGVRRNFKELRQESQKQMETLAQYKQTIDKLNANIEYFENYAQKLNIMAQLKFPGALKEVGGVGDGPANGQMSIPEAVPQDVDLLELESIGEKADQIERNLNTLLNYFENQSQILATTPSIWPAKGYLASAYGYRPDPFTGKRTMHWGLDIVTHAGNPVWATADGTVISTKSDKIGGRTVKINHRGMYTTVYCHLSEYKVKPGEKVKRGQVIGLVGRTGKVTGPHVHYEVRLNGKKVNPYYYILEE
jgi:murein DD-endopeptidase MepM/ murein hydrolase activator NlpD